MQNNTLNSDLWLEEILKSRSHDKPELIAQALSLVEIAGKDKSSITEQSCLAAGLEIATILSALNLDSSSIAASVLLPAVKYSSLSLDDVTEHVNAKVAHLLHGALQMDNISELYHISSGRAQHQHNIDNIRKMILAMVDDIRVVIIKLAERLCVLRHAESLSAKTRHEIAAEIMAIYAPLTHRLGIAQLKWELEDLAFKYLEPEKYHEISAQVNKNFPERQSYIDEVIAAIKEVLSKSGLHDFQVTGRAKHVYSIYRKMQRKHKSLHELFDICAVRIFMPSIAACYTALSHVHAAWQNLPDEFDDYIVKPKPNGYSSIHTAIIGPKKRVVEIQIRTQEMHQHAELGIAAHWVYKENKQQTVGYEAKISWLREVLDWQQEVTKTDAVLHEIRQVFNDMVYVFTPDGDVFDLTRGATPLDFAYHVHSDVGHRCSGAKVNGKIVPLTYALQTGDRVEILTSKTPEPSRDWLNPNLGYLKTSRARSKVFSWFKRQTQEQHLALGQEIFAKESRRSGLKKIDLSLACSKLNFKSNNELLIALGNGTLKFNSIITAQEIGAEKSATPEIKVVPVKVAAKPGGKLESELQVYDVNNLLTKIAGCCKPLPGETIVGYVTQNQGITVHRKTCANILAALKTKPERLLEVSWGAKTKKRYPVNLVIKAFDRQGLVRDVTNILADENIMVLGLDLVTDKKENSARINMTIEIESVTSLERVLSKINNVASVTEARKSN